MCEYDSDVMNSCPLPGCDLRSPHGHGTDRSYGEDRGYSVDTPGTLDHLLHQAYLAGARNARQQHLMPTGGDAPDFEQWRRGL